MASARSSKDPKELYLLKQKAMKYFEENMVPVKMEEVLNSMFYEDPPDVYGHLVNFFSQFTKPAKLCRFSALEVFDAQGMSTCQTHTYCTVNNKEKLLSTTTIPNPNLRVSPEHREKAEHEIHHSIKTTIKMINETLSDRLTGMDPTNQEEIDAVVLSVVEKLKEEELERRSKEEEETAATSPPPPVVEEKDKKKSAKDKDQGTDSRKGGKNSAAINLIPDRPLEKFMPGSEVVSAISQAVCACAAAAQNIPIYRHISNISRKKGAVHEFRMPLPIVTIIQSGKLNPGKSNCIKEYMIVPGIEMQIDKSIEHIQNIYHYVAKSLASKQGVTAKFVNESGALCPALDTPTQGLDILQEAVNAQGLTIGEDIHIVLNACAREFFDYEKGKYEVVSGQLKSADDMVDFWSDIISKYPSILAIIDPIRGEEFMPWMKLCERVSEAVFVVGDNFYVRPGLLRKVDMPDPMSTSGITMYLERMNSVSDIIDCADKFGNAGNEIIISANNSETPDTFLVDLAVGLNARFLKVGGPCCGERSNKLNRLLEIFQELEPPVPLPSKPSSADSQDQSEPGTAHELRMMVEGAERAEEVENIPEEVASTAGQDKEAGEEAERESKACSCVEVEPEEETRWGEDEKSRLKMHTPFTFPLIQNPPPPENEGEETEREDKASLPTTKRTK